jgi:hypothetical protein
LFLPHTRNPVEDWAVNRKVQKNKKASLVFMHQSVIGSLTSNGYLMKEGLSPNYFKRFRGQVFSGDIHVPQNVGPVIYVGTPYSVRFNDHFKPRVIVLSDFPEGDCGVAIPYCGLLWSELEPNLPGRCTVDIHAIEDLQQAAGNLGDQIKVRVHVNDVEDWPTFKEEIEAECKALEFDLCSLHLIKEGKLPLRKKRLHETQEKDPGLIVQSFGKRQGLTPASIKRGRRILKEN